MSSHPAPNQAPFTAGELAAAVSGIWIGPPPPPDTMFRGVETDSRRLHPGTVFVPLNGVHSNGHNFFPQAAERGAGVALCEANRVPEHQPLPLLQVPNTLEALGLLARWHRCRFSIPVVAVTGSYGKTTTRAFTAATVRPRRQALATEGNFNNEIGLPLTLLQLQEAHEVVVLEMAMRGAGQIAELCRIAQPIFGIVSSLGPQHIELLRSMEAIAQAKAELVAALPRDGLCLLPADASHLATLQDAARCQTLTFGFHNRADYRIVDAHITAGGLPRATLRVPGGRHVTLAPPRPGQPNLTNGAAAVAMAVHLGVPLEEAAAALTTAEVPAGRMRVVQAQVAWFKYTKKKTGTGRRILKMAPLHHHFEKSGWTETQVVVRFWIITMLLCLIGLASLKLR